jgi:thiol-disulfide isomerase/thioredoxin
MKPTALFAAAALGLASLSALAAPPTDEQVDQAVSAYRDATKQLPRGDRAAATKAATTVLEPLDLSEASLAQLKKLGDAALLGLVESKSAQADARLKELARAKDSSGAEAATLRLMTLAPVTTPTKEARDAYTAAFTQRVVEEFAHPGLPAALKEGKSLAAFTHLGRIDRTGLTGTNFLSTVESAITPDIHVDAAMRLTSLSSLMDEGSGFDRAAVDSLRVKALAAVTAVLARPEPPAPEKATRLEDARRFFDGAFAKGKLLNHTAPNLAFTWSNSPTTIKSLEDLRGKVVMLDFWATWCGPCIASFPNIRELAARYKDYPVVIVGVTSIQGSHYDQKATDPQARRIDCKGDPAKEMGLMPKFISDMEMNWTVAFSEQNVFNPEYGVFGIPHAVIIDPKGVVRHRGIHPGGDPAEEAGKIDAILKEFKLAAPPEAMPSKSKKEENKGG